MKQVTPNTLLAGILVAVSVTACQISVGNSTEGDAIPMNKQNMDTASGQLSPCPSTPNCVCSVSEGDDKHVEALGFDGDASLAMETISDVISSMKRTRIVKKTDNYLRAEYRSLVFRFVDDVELKLNAEKSVFDILEI